MGFLTVLRGFSSISREHESLILLSSLVLLYKYMNRYFHGNGKTGLYRQHSLLVIPNKVYLV
jgi:hypothetical protein